MISQIFDGNSFKVLALFALSPGSRFRRNEIKERTKLHNVPLDNALSRIAGAGIIRKERNLYSVNLENAYAEHIISLLSSQHRQLKNIPLDVYFLLADAVEEISCVKDIEIWLFGSYSKMVYSDKSDVDIAILGECDKEKIMGIFKKLEKHYGKEVEEHFFDLDKFYKNKKDPLVKEILQNGIRLV